MLLSSHDHKPVYSLGQNFLADPNVVRKLVGLADLDATSRVVEVGAGTGAITGVLADVAEHVVAYEVDSSLKGVLEEAVGDRANVDLRFQDVTKLVLGDELGEGQWTMVANLPFNVGAGVVLDALRYSPAITKLVVMLQREVAERLVARPGTKVYGVPSVVVSLYATGAQVFNVAPQVLEPQPRVESSVVVIRRITEDEQAERASQIAAAAFGQRRKMLRRSLSDFFDDTDGVLATAGVAPTARPEELEALDFVSIARAELAMQ